MPDELTIASVLLPGRSDVFKVTLRDGLIAAIRPAEQTGEAAWLALPGLVNLHAHADRAYTVQSFRPRSLADAVAAAAAARALFTAADVAARATRLFERSVEHGVTRMQDPHRRRSRRRAAIDAKACWRRSSAWQDRLDVDVIAFSTSKNDLAEPRALDRLERAVAMGADLIGASLNASADPPRALTALFDLAEQSGLAGRSPPRRASRAEQHARGHGRRCGHRARPARPRHAEPCLRAGGARRGRRGRADRKIRPLLKSPSWRCPRPISSCRTAARGARSGAALRSYASLFAAGVTVRCGTDNVRDWFYPFGDGDMLETALFAAVAAHLDDHGRARSRDLRWPRRASRRASRGSRPDACSSLDDALARRPGGRVVFKGGRQVAGDVAPGGGRSRAMSITRASPNRFSLPPTRPN